MNYDAVQKLVETHLQDEWTATAIQFENQPFNSDMYVEYLRSTLQFGDSVLRSLGTRCFRTIGILFLDFFVRPGVGSHRLAELARIAAGLYSGVTLNPAVLGESPNVVFLEPSLSKDYAERTGWVSAQLRLSFYFDTEE